MTNLSTTPSKRGERTNKYMQRKHLPTYWEVLGDFWRGYKMDRKEKEKKTKASDAEGDDQPHHNQGGGFPPRSNNRGLPSNDGMFGAPQFHNAPNQAPPGGPSGFHAQGHAQAQPQFHNMPSMNNARSLQSGEMNPHLQRGGQTEIGERPRGQGQSVYFDDERTVPGGGRGGGAPNSRPAQHPWLPATQVYDQERTRLGR